MYTHTQEEQEQEEEESKNNKYIVDIVDHLNMKTGKNFKSNSKKTKSLINSHIREGFKVEDFKKVIDIKTSEWLNDKQMAKYLRPETLFGNKFEGYLNQNPKKLELTNDENIDEYMELSRRFENV